MGVVKQLRIGEFTVIVDKGEAIRVAQRTHGNQAGDGELQATQVIENLRRRLRSHVQGTSTQEWWNRLGKSLDLEPKWYFRSLHFSCHG